LPGEAGLFWLRGVLGMAADLVRVRLSSELRRKLRRFMAYRGVDDEVVGVRLALEWGLRNH
jgi:hypothetical protein